MTRQKAALASAVTALAVVAGLAPAGKASNGSSCVGQLASADAGRGYGTVISSIAHDAQPFGSIVSFNATSSKSDCPFTP